MALGMVANVLNLTTVQSHTSITVKRHDVYHFPDDETESFPWRDMSLSELIGGTASTALAVGALVENGPKLDVPLQNPKMWYYFLLFQEHGGPDADFFQKSGASLDTSRDHDIQKGMFDDWKLAKTA
ncbi:hypothetical protein PV11_06787 [Exophiala sideris]|uniref:Uncharacterized protein n=1 Tax=Exophiala sideris TaxID=1016849 RepID=A0A0D1Y8I8_9EURO|nr:hypothetical protein PV11_06787 [Exophiala sideris]